jgi:hypothetical protein
MTEEQNAHTGESFDTHPEAWQRTFDQMWGLFFGPEIERRRQTGSLPDNFFPYAAQVLFPQEGRPSVLLNVEVRGEARLGQFGDRKTGDDIYIEDLNHLEVFDLPDDLLDHGHFTILRSGSAWRMMFNFLSGRAKARDMLELARQYHKVAVSSHSLGFSGPTIDNLFSASELICKAELILHRSPAVTSKTHSSVGSAINRWSRLGNIDSAFVALFNKLSQQRPNARYGDTSSRPPLPDKDDLDLVAAMIDEGIRTVRKSTDRDFNTQERAQTDREGSELPST